MLQKKLGSLAVIAFLSACGGSNPFIDNSNTTDTGTGTGTGSAGSDITSNGLPPGTANPSPNLELIRSEPKAESNTDANYGNGFANNFQFDAVTDTFRVEGLAFDGDQPNGTPYTRSAFGTLSKPGNPVYGAYEAPSTHPDFLTGKPVDQLQHRAIYGSSGSSEFAIVRTGSYAGYGFGGFIYKRNGAVEYPADKTNKQATFSGDYAGLRDFQGRGGLEYVTGDMTLDIDLNGFLNNCSGPTCAEAIKFSITNRQIFDLDGTNITATYLAAANEDKPADASDLLELQPIFAKLGPDRMTVNGEAFGEVTTTRFGTEHLSGSYYLVLGGNLSALPGGEVVGVVVLEGPDPRGTRIIERETGGFILKR